MKSVVLFVPFLLFVFQANAQVADRPTVASSGDFYLLNGAYTFQSTVGETAIQTLQSNSLMLTQGFQQPEQLINLPIPAGGTPAEVIIYPNPAVDQVKIQFQLDAPAWVSFLLVNNAGQIIRKLPLTLYPSGIQEVPFDFHIPSGLYLLTLYYEGKTLAYKVIVQ